MCFLKINYMQHYKSSTAGRRTEIAEESCKELSRVLSRIFGLGGGEDVESDSGWGLQA